jgi:hypothetical protein
MQHRSHFPEDRCQARSMAFINILANHALSAAKRFNRISVTTNQPRLEKRIEAARREAITAPMDALAAFMGSVQIDPLGQMVCQRGSAYLVLRKPNAAFRETAYSVGLIHHYAFGHGREYALMDFQIPRGHPASPSAAAQEIFCFTDGLVMQKTFPFEHWLLVLSGHQESQSHRWLYR